ncbi:MAG: hypothetical protein SangKO_021050 [Sandaracinaceae bacterium]|nr:hypothetical protein [Myxococcales bacterium]
MRRTLIAIATAAASLLVSCGGEAPPPEGFHMRLRFMSADPAVFETVTVRIDPNGADERFMFVEPMTYADGNIRLEIDGEGAAILELDGPYVASLAENEGGLNFIFDLEVWTPEDQMERRPPPFVTVNVERAGEVIAMGDSFLANWPLPLGGQVEIEVPCRAADRCTP